MTSSTRTVAVTGATGFLGSHLTERLIAEGCQLNILARSAEKADKFVGRVAQIVYGDITDRAALEELMAGCECVVHLVSNFRVVKGTPKSYAMTNVEGTVQALAAARAVDVKRFVHCSTIGVHGDVARTPATETSPYNPGDLYQETKLEAENACRREMERGGMEVVIVRPTSQYGPGDTRMLKMFRMLAARKFILIGACKENFHAVYIDDLVQGFWLAMNTPGIGGETFFLGGPSYVSLDEYIKTAAQALGVAPPKLRVPYWPVHALAWGCEIVCKPFGIEPPLHRRRVKFFKNNRAFSIAKAQAQLGYHPRVELLEGMQRTVAWYREHGYLDPA